MYKISSKSFSNYLKFIFGLLILFIALSCGTQKQKTKQSVTYEITGTAELVSITYENDNGGTSQLSSESVPHTIKVGKMSSVQFVYISAQNKVGYGSVTVTIYIDGKQFKTSTSTGEYVIASVSGSIP